MTLGNMRELWVRLIACCLMSSWATFAYSEDRSDYVFISDEAYAAFQCSVFAAQARYDAEETRLFARGLEKARLFIKAAREGRVSKDDFARTNDVWPLALRAWNYFQPQDTSTDFVAGQVYDMIWETNTSDLGQQQPKGNYQQPARGAFLSHNCAFLGK
jgi:hypothetical protein